MTSSMTWQGSLKVGPLYSSINRITTFFVITRTRAKISPLQFLCVSIITFWLHLYRNIFMTSLMTSPGHKIGKILKLIYLRLYLSQSVDQNLKILEMLMAIFLVCSTSGITSCEKVCRKLKMVAILKNWNIKHNFNLTSDMTVPNYAPKRFFYFMVMTSSMTSKGGLKVSLYIHV